MNIERDELFERVEKARRDLWRVLDDLDDDQEIYPDTRKRELLAHIAGWEAMVFDAIHAQLLDQAPPDHGYIDVETANARFVAVRASTTIADARLECEINRFAILTLLREFKDFNAVLRLPWGTETVAEFIENAIEHEEGHRVDIMGLKAPGIH